MSPFIANSLTGGEVDVIQPKRRKRHVLNRETAEKALCKVHDIFGKHDLIFFLLCGTLLGAVRDGDFTETDKDIDLGLYSKDLKKIYKCLGVMKNSDFEIVRVTADDSFVQVQHEGVYIDLCIMTRLDNETWRCGRYYEPEDYFSVLRNISFLGREFKIPDDYGKYLTNRFGNWRVPDPDYRKRKNFQRSKKH